MCIHEYTHKHTKGKTFLIKNVTRMRKFSHDLGNCKYYYAKGFMVQGRQF